MHRVFQSRHAYSSAIDLWDTDNDNTTHSRRFYRMERPYLLFDPTATKPIALFTGWYPHLSF
jgi:hypothetical protein